jgi:SPP1 family predicted phage head-tail adaptor
VLRVGELDKLFTIENPVEPTPIGADGNPQPAWALASTAWCSLEGLTDRELTAMGRTAGQATYAAKTWYTTSISKKSRLKWNSRTFSVVSVLNVREANVELELLLEEERA